MKYIDKISVKLASAGFVLATAMLFMFGGSASANASCLYQYVNNGDFTTSSTPVFNSICGIPTVGDETNFVRIRQSSTTTTNPTATQDEATGNTYSTTDINSDCTTGQEFDVWNYLHNNALTQDNDNGSGSAVAHGVTGTLAGPVGTSGKTFNFGYTVSASNAATVSDSINLNCSNDVSLTLVPGSIHVLTSPTGSWQDLIPESTSSLNTPLTLGNPTWGSGDQWGCWNYRILIIYEVEVTPVPTPTTPTCTSLTNDMADIESVNLSGSANITGYTLNLYKGSTASGKPVDTQKPTNLPFTFTDTLTAGQAYTVTATAHTSDFGDITGPNCLVSFTTPTTPPSTPPSTPSAQVTSLTNTGPGTGAMVAIFAGVTVAGAAIYNRVIRRHLADK